jgi:DNA-binding IclR family transcriptional regulator
MTSSHSTTQAPGALSATDTGIVVVKPVVYCFRIVRMLTENRTPMRASTIGRELEINPSTCFNILRTMTLEGILSFDSQSKTYGIGNELEALLQYLMPQGTFNMIEAARPLLQKAAASLNVTITLWKRLGKDRIMLICNESNPGAIRIDMATGQRLPHLMGASGRLFAHYDKTDDDELRRAFDKVRWARPLSFTQYKEEIQQINHRGWAIDDGYFSAGITAVAAPVLNSNNEMLFSVSAITFRGAHSEEHYGYIGNELNKLARKLSDLFTYQ